MSDLTSAEIEERICTQAAHIAAAMYRWLRLLSEFDRRTGWGGAGLKSFAHWLAWRCGIDLHTARQYIKVARALDDLPLICEAFSRGELSYSKVRALCRIATPETEKDLLVFARAGTASHVEKLVSGYRKCLPPDLETVNDAYRKRYVEWRYDDDGSVLISMKLPADEGAEFVLAINTVLEQVRKTHRRSPDAMNGSKDGSAEPSLDRADAVAEMARRELAGQRSAGASSGDRHQVVVHIDVETILRGTGSAAIDCGAGIATETAKRLLCGSSIVGVVRGADGNVLDVGRKDRAVPPAMQRALRIRDGGCVFPGCTNVRFIDGHHINHWINGGVTALHNLASLCPFHHRLLHEGGYTMKDDGAGAFAFFTAQGDPIVVAPAPATTGWDVESQNAELGLRLNAKTAMAQWGGETCDYGVATETLLRKNGIGTSGQPRSA